MKSNNDVVISSTILKNNGGFIVNGTNNTLNYNRIYKNCNSNGLNNTGNNTNSELNWWGVNNALSQITDTGNNLTLSHWYVLMLSADEYTTFVNATLNPVNKYNVTLGYKLNTNIDILNDPSLLPYFNVAVIGPYNQTTTGDIRNTTLSYFAIGTDNYFSIQSLSDDEHVILSIFLSKMKTITTITADDKTYGENATASITLTDINGNPLTANVTINVNGVNYTINVINGNGIFVGSILDAGNYNITVYYLGGNNYYSSNDTDTFKVTPLKTITTITADDKTYGENATASITLTDINGNPLTANVIVKLNGVEYKVKVVNGKGTFIGSVLAGGKYIISVYYLGDNNYYSSNASDTFNVKPLKTIITIKVTNVGHGKKTKAEITLTDINGKALTATVIVKLNGVEYKVKVVNGKGTFIGPILDSGKYTISVYYPGCENYTASSNSTEFIVKENKIIPNKTDNINKASESVIKSTGNPVTIILAGFLLIINCIIPKYKK
ncbi:Ig-like domain-containing protein [Methanobrevibacter sp. V74]|uniref:Ig-like domain-containing protein n=1 Tax=Methanobrevibacter sp. V74 TaxID=3064279 RepID=UPI002737578E|nr:Ig-like domain-containing protein [Methanobrevibacter sp. V74]